VKEAQKNDSAAKSGNQSDAKNNLGATEENFSTCEL